jgi:hypothetical protein
MVRRLGPRLRRSAGPAALLLSGALLSARPAHAPAPKVDEVLRRAGERVVALESELAVTAAKERYAQALLMIGPQSSSPERRELVSDVAWVPTGDALVWAFYRDVLSVDGRPVEGREGRLYELFSGGRAARARDRAQRILEESARYNLGTHRTVNSPTVALSFLHPRNRPRFRFRAAGSETVEGVPVMNLRFEEVVHPTLTRTAEGANGEDIPAHGVLSIGPEAGILVSSELRFDVPRLGPVQITVRFGPQPRLDAWLPAEMCESYGYLVPSPDGHEWVEAVATYSDYRKAEVEVQEIRPVP